MDLSKQRIVFEVPFNGDDELIRAYGEYKDRIAMVYGRAEYGYPQGRKTNKAPVITLENIFRQAEVLRGWGSWSHCMPEQVLPSWEGFSRRTD